MLSKLIKILHYYPRRVQPTIKLQQQNRQQKQKIINQNDYKKQLKFTQQQLTQLSQPNRKLKRTNQQILKQKILKQKQNEQSNQFQKKVKKNLTQKYRFISGQALLAKQERVKPQQISLDQLSRIRLHPQYLPLPYLKRVQKIFNKYDQKHLRQITQYFSKLMSLRYSQQKLYYDQYPDLKFDKLQLKLPKQKQIQQIYLIGENKIYQEKDQNQNRKIDDNPINPQISYTQNVVLSYLLNRVPRTFSSAIRVMIQIKYKFPDFKPQSMIDFGSGLSSGSYAFADCFEDTGMIYNVQPNAKMRKLSRYLTQDTKIHHYETLGQLSRLVKHVDLVYMGYVLTQLRPQMTEVYLEALHTKVKPGGLLILIEYGSPYGARLIHEVRKWAIKKGSKIVAPCPHQMKCPLSYGNQWCHFDQSSGMYPRSIFGKLPTDHSVQLQKFSYIVIKKSQKVEEQDQLQQNIDKLNIEENVTKDWDRILFPTMKRGGHIILNLCTKSGRYQRRVIGKSNGEQYKASKKLKWGDLWRFGKRIPNRFRKQRKSGKRLW